MVIGMVGRITGVDITMITVISGGITWTVILDSTNTVVHGMATSAARQGAARDKAADVTSKTPGGPVVMRRVSPRQHGMVLIIMDIGFTPITQCGLAQISLGTGPRRWKVRR